MQIPPKPWKKGKKASQRWQCHDVHQLPGRGQGEETVTREGARRRYLLSKQPSYPILSCAPSHMPTKLCAQVCQLYWLAILLCRAGSRLSAPAHSTWWGLLYSFAHSSQCVCCIFLEIKKGALALQVGRCWALGPFGCISA